MTKTSSGFIFGLVVGGLIGFLISPLGPADIRQQLLILIIMTIITLPLGLLVVRIGFNRARKVGSLSQY